MILRTAPGAIVLFLLLTGSIVAQDDDSLAGSFLSGKSLVGRRSAPSFDELQRPP